MTVMTWAIWPGPDEDPFRTQLQMIFQDSYSSLNPRKHVFEILAEPMLYHGLARRGDVYSPCGEAAGYGGAS